MWLLHISSSASVPADEETLSSKSATSLSLDSSGNLKWAKNARTEDAPLSGDHQLRTAFTRPALAYDMAGIASFSVLDRWIQKVMAKVAETPPSQDKQVSVKQIMHADKAFWIKAANETRSRLATAAGGVRPVHCIDASPGSLMLHCTFATSSTQIVFNGTSDAC